MKLNLLQKQSSLLAALVSLVMTASAENSGNPLGGLEQLKNFSTERASSSDLTDRNGDARPIAPGATLVLADLAGPGEIVHFWCTIADSEPYYSRLLTLRIYWDGEEHPSVECPIGDFFGIGMGVDKPFTSQPIRVTSDGRGRNCYWPMPFRKHALITFTNDSEKEISLLTYQIDYEAGPVPQGAGYFHAQWRRARVERQNPEYTILDGVTGEGRYVGTFLSWTQL